MSRSSGFNLAGTYPSIRQQQQHATSAGSSGVSFAPGNNQDLIHIHSSDLFPSNHGAYHSQIQNSGPPSYGLRPMSSTYDQLMHQYQHPQNQSQFRMQQMSGVSQSYRDQSVKSLQQSTQQQIPPDPYGLLGLLNVIRMSDPYLTSLSLGIDLTILGLNLNSADNLHKTFGSPWSDEPIKGETEYSIPSCYYTKQPSPLQMMQTLLAENKIRFHLSDDAHLVVDRRRWDLESMSGSWWAYSIL